jgi:glucosamine-6-phosphate deaminase
MNDLNRIPESELGQGSGIKLAVCETEFDLYWQVALEVFDLIHENNKIGRPTMMIVPYGPVGPYSRLVWLVNHYRLSLQQCTFINMDEYLDETLRYLSTDHPLSFRGGMERVFYSQVDAALNVPEEQRIFPEPGNEERIWGLIEAHGGLDLCFGGVGINGHIAFNEPPERGVNMSNETFKALPTRILKLARETKTINAYMNCSGDLQGIPDNCITVGMKEIWSARKVRMCMPRDWNAGALRKVLHGPVTCRVPSSLFQEHPDAKLYAAAVALRSPEPAIRLYNK